MPRSQIQQLMQYFSASSVQKVSNYSGVIMLDQEGTLIYQTDPPSHATLHQWLGAQQIDTWEKITSVIQCEVKELYNANQLSLANKTSLTLLVPIGKGKEIFVKCEIANRLNAQTGTAIIVEYQLIRPVNFISEAPSLAFNWLKVLESVVVNTKDAVLLIEANTQQPASTKIVFVNQSFVDITGYKAHKVIGKSARFFKAIFYDQDQLQTIKNAIKKHSAFEITLKNVRKNGLVYNIDCSFTPLTNELGVHTHWIVIVRDITEKKQLEVVLQKASQLSGMGSWTYDLQTRQIFWSDTAKEIYEVNADFEPNLANTTAFFKYCTGNLEVLQKIGVSFETAKPFDLEIEILTFRGNKKWIRIIGEPEIVNGNYQRINGSFQDIDVRKRAELLAAKIIQEKNEIFESIGDGFFAVDSNWKVVFWNSRAAQELKRSKEELLNHNLWEVFSEAVGSYAYNQYHDAMTSKIPVHFETCAKATGHWYDISAYPSANGLSVYFKNITLQKEDRLRLADSEKRYSYLFHLSPLPKWVFEMSTLRFIDVNKAAIKHYGYSYKEFMSMSITDIRPPSELERLQQVLQQNTLKKKFMYQGIFTHQKKNKELIRVGIRSTLINFKGQKAKLVIANDVTEQEQYIQAIENQNQMLKEVSWIQSHVFRAPLSKLMGLIEVLKTTDREQDRTLALNYMEDAATELDQVIKEVTKKTTTRFLVNESSSSD